jgi:hypothetical protein
MLSVGNIILRNLTLELHLNNNKNQVSKASYHNIKVLISYIKHITKYNFLIRRFIDNKDSTETLHRKITQKKPQNNINTYIRKLEEKIDYVYV